MRAATRRLTSNARERGCGRVPVAHLDGHPSIKVRAPQEGERRACWQGVMACGHIWSCPVCSQNLRAERAERIAAALRALGGRWQMVTITLRHRAGMRLDDDREPPPPGPPHVGRGRTPKRGKVRKAGLLSGMLAAWRRARQGGRIQRVWTERVTASVRATEITYGTNGWHPHLHVLLRTEEWDEDERDALLARWKVAIERELGAECRPDDVHALQWSEPFDASDAAGRETYLVKLGLEVAGHGKSKGRTQSPWSIAELAASGDVGAWGRWQEYLRATTGRRMVELDDRAAAAAAALLEAQRIEGDRFEDGQLKDDVKEASTIIEVQRDDLRALRWLERSMPAILAVVLSAAEQEGREGVHAWIGYAWRRWREHVAGEGAASRGPPVHAGSDAA